MIGNLWSFLLHGSVQTLKDFVENISDARDGMKKLTEEWKVKKRKHGNQSFKELIDFKLPNTEEKDKTPSRKVARTSSSKAVLKHDASKFQNTPQSKKIHSGPLRRSTRLHSKAHENRKVIAEEFSKVIQDSSVPDLCENENESIIVNEKSVKTDEAKDLDHACNLSQWGLPLSVVEAYKSRNIYKMFQWQYECLCSKNVLEGRNLVFSAPTSAGKTLVAEILMLKKVTETGKKAIMILPFVSVVREKVHYFQEMFQNAGIIVDGYMGAHHPPGGFKAVDIAICTIEKANNLINRLMEEKRLTELGILVVDELHMLGDHGRGYLLELLLTKLLYNCKRNNIDMQIIGMSATLPNLNVLSTWLDSELFKTDFRPVPLQEMVKIGSILYDAKTKAVCRDLQKNTVSFSGDLDHTLYLTIETVAAGHGVLIFCPSKNWCENLATTIAKEIYTVGNPNAVSHCNADFKIIGEKLRENLNGSLLNDIILQLQNSPAGLDSVLALTVPFGVAFHHAGLTFDERDIIEGAFRQGILKVLVATTTLSSGVNLPARRVIIRSPLFCGVVIDVLSYKQMVGRAGRKGIDSEGESILLCKESERNAALTLVNSDLHPVKSCLLKSGSTSVHSSLKRALIEVIASGVASSQKEVLEYVSCTLLYASLAAENETSNSNVEGSIEKCIEYLVDNDIIFKNEETKNDSIEINYKPSRLGLAILASGFSPDDALRILKELQLARRCFVLENDLHILYEVTPPYLSDQMGGLNWMHFLSLWEQLPDEYKRVGELVGVQENFIGLGIQGKLNKNSHKFFHKLAVHQRFYASLALNDLIQEMPLNVVAEKYDCTRGILQSLQQTTSTFAGMLTVFCNRLGWYNLELLFASFQKRVHFGIQQELCDLVRLSTLNAQRARALYNAGFETISSLACASPDEVALVLCNMGSFESAKQLEGNLAEEILKRSQAKRIRITGKHGVNEKEAADLIIEEAQNFIKQELGISNVSWKHLAVKKFQGIQESQSSPHDIISNCSKSLNNKDGKPDEAIDLDKYPEILKKMYASESSESQESCQLVINNELLKNQIQEDTFDDLDQDKTKKAKVFNSYVKSVKENITGLLENHDLLNTDVDKSVTNSFDYIKKLCPLSGEASKKEKSIIEKFFPDSKTVQSFNVEQHDISKTNSTLDNSLDIIEEVHFSELLLSQTAETENLYLTKSFLCESDANLEINCHQNFGTYTVENNEILSKETVTLSTVTQDKNSVKAFPMNSVLGDSDIFLPDSIFSIYLHNLSQKDKNINISEEKEVINSVRSGLNSNNLLNSHNNLLKKSEFNAHSTPIRNSLDEKSIFNIVKSEKTLDKPLDYINPLNYSNENKNSGNDSLCTVSSHSSLLCKKNELTDEISGDIFFSDGSFSQSLDDKNCKNDLPNNERENPILKEDKTVKLDTETSGDIFDEDSFDNAIGNLEFNGNDLPIKNSCDNVKQTSKAAASDETLRNPCLSSKIDPKSDINFKVPDTEHNIISEKINTCLRGLPVSLQSNEKENISSKNLKPEEESQFWKSWNPSGDDLDLSNISENTEALNKGIININDNENLTLNSADNSLFDSFTSDILPPTPTTNGPEKTQITVDRQSTNLLSLTESKEFHSTNEKSKTVNLSFKDDNKNLLVHMDAQDKMNFKTVEIPDMELQDFFKKISRKKKISFSVACEKNSVNCKSIGPPKITKNSMPSKNGCVVDQNIVLKGLAFYYGEEAFYIAISDQLTPGKDCSSLAFSKKMELVRQFFNDEMQCETIVAYDIKSQYKILWQGCNISLKQKCMDPSIAAWLLDPALGQQSLKVMSYNYWPEAISVLDSFDNSYGSLGLQHWSSTPGKQRASTEAFITFHLMEKLVSILKDQHLYKAFTKVEMPSILVFSKMEQNGLGFNTNLAITYQKELQKKQQDILDKAYQMAGRRFNILSSKEVSRILFKELKLSPAVTPDCPSTHRLLDLGTPSRIKRLPPELKTNKECLEKILHLHPLPKAILDWRKLSFSTTKVLMPLLRKYKHDNYFNMDRLYATSYIYTLTGRVNVHSPNLQFIPRDFNIDYVTQDDTNKDENLEEYHCTDEDISQFGVSLRNLFIPSKGNVLLSADYSQLELRILAHLSKDKKLINSLNSGEDVFKNIASNWMNISPDSVSNEQRQQAKKICYGMIYGISTNALSQQLNTTKENAFNFMETFKNSYPGLNAYFQSVIRKCSTNGYVSTLMQRRRYLPLINSENRSEKSHAERQAINTTIQGSAADLIKTAMIKIENILLEIFPDSRFPYSSSIPNYKLRTKQFRGAFLVLQMHDELIFEVNKDDLEVVLKIVKDAMEKTTKLSVKLPVRVRTGITWGEMTEIT
ncbi:DNA polymerase theta [Trichonephila inaurata madagascariensis]|uniref:DNA polymerase theta n=1 Tax=Trichonephila inaurata madagascariensis TaxID=2747483 RepID=A0A8X6Y214_9ARAC|nr:DNA polymerase theta [Trichonephila inaurata madagascariensis]